MSPDLAPVHRRMPFMTLCVECGKDWPCPASVPLTTSERIVAACETVLEQYGGAPMRFAYIDPPYLGCCNLYGHFHGDGTYPFDGGCWDDPQTHADLIVWLEDTFPDGWALSCSTPSLRTLLPLCAADVRVGAWVKPFAVFKPNVNPGYTWEPVIFRGGRKHVRADRDPTIRDFYRQPVDAVAANITLKKGLTGAKPIGFCDWVLDLLNVREGDELVDVFPGTGVMGERFAARCEEALSA